MLEVLQAEKSKAVERLVNQRKVLEESRSALLVATQANMSAVIKSVNARIKRQADAVAATEKQVEELEAAISNVTKQPDMLRKQKS